jgi:hypothetical protein
MQQQSGVRTFPQLRARLLSVCLYNRTSAAEDEASISYGEMGNCVQKLYNAHAPNIPFLSVAWRSTAKL